MSKRCRWNGKQCRPCSDCSLIWAYTVCPDLSVRKLRIITVFVNWRQWQLTVQMESVLETVWERVWTGHWPIIHYQCWQHGLFLDISAVICYIHQNGWTALPISENWVTNSFKDKTLFNPKSCLFAQSCSWSTRYNWNTLKNVTKLLF